MGSCYIKDVIHTCHCYKGYEEEPEHPNWTIFADRLDKVHYFNTNKQSYEWCLTYAIYCLFVNCEGDSADYDDYDRKADCLNFTYEPYKDNCACAAWAAAGYFKSAGQWYKTPKIGDFIFFKNSKYKTDYNPEGIYHGGLVIDVDDNRVYTSEGNKNTGGSPGIVGEYDYSLNYNAIEGYGRPYYDGYERKQTENTGTNWDEVFTNLAWDCYEGKYGNGLDRKHAINGLGYGNIFSEVQKRVNMIVAGLIKK